MKNLMKLGFSFLILCVFLLSSCTKETPLQPEKAENPPAALNNEDVQLCFDNPNNPYEYVGVQHNAGLDAIAATPGFESLSLEEAHTIAQQQIGANLSVDIPVGYQEVTDAYDYVTMEDPFLAVAQHLFDDGYISQLAFDRLLELNQILDDSEDPISFGNAVIDLENAILAENAYTTDELETILGACSMARHSACYWLTAALDATNPWNPLLGLDANDLKGDVQSRWGWWKKVKRFFKKVIRFVKNDIAGYKFAKKVVGWLKIFGIKIPIIVSVVVGVVYSFARL